MIKVKDGIATREPIPHFLSGLAPGDLRNLGWTDSSLGVQDCEWWPEESGDGNLPAESKWGAEILTIDHARGVVVVTHDVLQMTADEIAAARPLRRITQLAFLTRFTDAEAIGIDLASQGTTVQAAAMRRHQAKVSAASHIDLDRADTRAGVQALEAAGLLGAGRAAEILDAPIQPHEVFRG